MLLWLKGKERTTTEKHPIISCRHFVINPLHRPACISPSTYGSSWESLLHRTMEKKSLRKWDLLRLCGHPTVRGVRRSTTMPLVVPLMRLGTGLSFHCVSRYV